MRKTELPEKVWRCSAVDRGSADLAFARSWVQSTAPHKSRHNDACLHFQGLVRWRPKFKVIFGYEASFRLAWAT